MAVEVGGALRFLGAVDSPTFAPRLMERVLGSLLVGSPGWSQLDQFGLRLIVPLPVQGQPMVQPWLNHRHDCAGRQCRSGPGWSVTLVQVQG